MCGTRASEVPTVRCVVIDRRLPAALEQSEKRFASRDRKNKRAIAAESMPVSHAKASLGLRHAGDRYGRTAFRCHASPCGTHFRISLIVLTARCHCFRSDGSRTISTSYPPSETEKLYL